MIKILSLKLLFSFTVESSTKSDAMKKILLFFSLLIIATAKSSRNVGSWCGRDRLSEIHDIFMGKKFKFPEVERRGRIYGGQPAQAGQFGFFTDLQSFDGRFLTPCGGALIKYNWVLTVRTEKFKFKSLKDIKKFLRV